MEESIEERRERIHLIRELKISNLLISSKIKEFQNERNKNNELNIKYKEMQNKNNLILEDKKQILKEIEKFKNINKQIEQENIINNKKKEELFAELKIGEVEAVDGEGNKEGEEEEQDEEYEIIN